MHYTMPRRKSETGQKAQAKNKKKSQLDENEVVDVISSPKNELKLRLKLGKETLGEKKLHRQKIEKGSLPPSDFGGMHLGTRSIDVLAAEDSLNVTPLRKEEDDEEAWLDALEKGDLDDYGELKKEKDPSLMTARQRAIKERTSVLSSKSFANVPLLGAAKETRVMTEEAQKRKDEKNKKRKLQAVKKAEESQKLTIERLVKQQGCKASKERQKKSNNNNVDSTVTLQQQKPDSKVEQMIKFTSKGRLVTLSLPIDTEFPIQAKSTTVEMHVVAQCAVCGGVKKYSCSKTGAPLCSLKCYKANLPQEAGK